MFNMHLYTTLYAYSCLFVLFFHFTCSDIIQRNVCLMLHFTFQRRVGGNCSFPIVWCVFRSRPTHSSFPTLKEGGNVLSHADCQWMQRWCEASKTKCQNAITMRCCATSIPWIDIPFDRCRRKQVPCVSDSDVHMSVGLQFWRKQPNKLFEMTCLTMMVFWRIWDARQIPTTNCFWSKHSRVPIKLIAKEWLWWSPESPLTLWHVLFKQGTLEV